ncbi:hypothetical protein DBR42_25385, partial [Pelomonas sp. HMWF004]
MADAPAPQPSTADTPAFDAAAFDQAVAEQRERAAAGDYAASTAALEQLLLPCPATEASRRAEVLALLAYQYPRLGRLPASARCATEALG